MSDEEIVDPSHPRYQSLMIRKKVAEAGAKGMLADSAMIAHGRGEAFDYMLVNKQQIRLWKQQEKSLRDWSMRIDLFYRLMGML